MTLNETSAMFEIITEYYPEMKITERTVPSWQLMIHKIKKEDMWRYVQAYVSESKFPPHVSDLKMMWQGDPSAVACNDKVGE